MTRPRSRTPPEAVETRADPRNPLATRSHQGLAEPSNLCLARYKEVGEMSAAIPATKPALSDHATRPQGLPMVQVAPLGGLMIVAAVIIFLVVVIAGNRLWALDFFHVVGAGLGAGIDLFVGIVIGPVIGRLSIAPAPSSRTSSCPRWSSSCQRW